ncbi:unnamed protein product [Paramecium sonneborni]|uniref:Uncharacterized protein n=1 Tax=Paramecium sonneborni TaxID=65129 RepID=A0A8S1PT50_9CILI|nr:unnamed protein product [Paramecium sonneborni]
MIPKLGVTKFAFKISEISYIMIGVGIREIVKIAIMKIVVIQEEVFKRIYCIYNPGYCYSRDQKEIDNKYIGWGFSTNDIIIFEVDMKNKYVKQTKQSINKSIFQFYQGYEYRHNIRPIPVSTIQLNSKGKIEIINQSFSQENY